METLRPTTNALQAGLPDNRYFRSSGVSRIIEKVVSTRDATHFVYEQDCEAIIQGVRDAEAIIKKKTRADGARYAGSVPLLVAQVWAKECGAPMGSREYAIYARKKLNSNEYQNLRAKLGM